IADLFISKINVNTGNVVWTKDISPLHGSFASNKIYLDSTNSGFCLSLFAESSLNSGLDYFVLNFDTQGEIVTSFQSITPFTSVTKSKIVQNGNLLTIGFGSIPGSTDTLNGSGFIAELDFSANTECLFNSVTVSTSDHTFLEQIPPPGFVIDNLDSTTVENNSFSSFPLNSVDLCEYLNTEVPPLSPIGLSVYPNPANGTINFSSSSTPFQLQISDASGKICFSKYIKEENISIPLNNWESGMYFYSIQNNSENIDGKFVKENW
ncbi:MAG: T9SS type A sorting domain-containing protein, partial [Crocinitomicaceae bacterium]